MEFKGLQFVASENLYHFLKAMAINDDKSAYEIQSARTANDAKQIAKNKVDPYLAPKWYESKEEVMQMIQDLWAVQCPIYRHKLLATGDLTLVNNMETDMD